VKDSIFIGGQIQGSLFWAEEVCFMLGMNIQGSALEVVRP